MNRIKFYREKKNLSQEELSSISKVSRTTISKLENNENIVITNITMKKIALALDETVNHVFFDEPIEEKEE